MDGDPPDPPLTEAQIQQEIQLVLTYIFHPYAFKYVRKGNYKHSKRSISPQQHRALVLWLGRMMRGAGWVMTNGQCLLWEGRRLRRSDDLVALQAEYSGEYHVCRGGIKGPKYNDRQAVPWPRRPDGSKVPADGGNGWGGNTQFGIWQEAKDWNRVNAHLPVGQEVPDLELSEPKNKTVGADVVVPAPDEPGEIIDDAFQENEKLECLAAEEEEYQQRLAAKETEEERLGNNDEADPSSC